MDRDGALVRAPPGQAMVHTVDFLRAFIDDPYLLGKVAANHALGGSFAMGAQAQSATAIATVPPGLESKVEDLLFQMMTGAVEVLNEAGCALVGGHTGEGRELALGFAINGLIDEGLAGVMRKGGMRPSRRWSCPTGRAQRCCARTVPPPAPTSPASVCWVTSWR
jgi:selenide,water dikinase